MKLTVSKKSFTEMLQGLVMSGCQFEAVETPQGQIQVTFNGSY